MILFSHHQPFSRLDKQGPNLQNTLADLFQKKAITAWYWGHEHNCIIYDKHPTFGTARPLHRPRWHPFAAQEGGGERPCLSAP